MFHAKQTNQSINRRVHWTWFFLFYSPAPRVGSGLNVNWYCDVINGVSIIRGEELRLGHRSTATVWKYTWGFVSTTAQHTLDTELYLAITNRVTVSKQAASQSRLGTIQSGINLLSPSQTHTLPHGGGFDTELGRLTTAYNTLLCGTAINGAYFESVHVPANCDDKTIPLCRDL